jgi:hypothetical protein
MPSSSDGSNSLKISLSVSKYFSIALFGSQFVSCRSLRFSIVTRA